MLKVSQGIVQKFTLFFAITSPTFVFAGFFDDIASLIPSSQNKLIESGKKNAFNFFKKSEKVAFQTKKIKKQMMQKVSGLEVTAPIKQLNQLMLRNGKVLHKNVSSHLNTRLLRSGRFFKKQALSLTVIKPHFFSYESTDGGNDATDSVESSIDISSQSVVTYAFDINTKIAMIDLESWFYSKIVKNYFNRELKRNIHDLSVFNSEIIDQEFVFTDRLYAYEYLLQLWCSDQKSAKLFNLLEQLDQNMHQLIDSENTLKVHLLLSLMYFEGKQYQAAYDQLNKIKQLQSQSLRHNLKIKIARYIPLFKKAQLI